MSDTLDVSAPGLSRLDAAASDASAGGASTHDTPGAVVIIGAGLIGTSIGLALTQQGCMVYLQDRTSSHALVAAGLGAGSVERPHDVTLVIVAVPPAATSKAVIRALREYPAATVTDVASVKSPITDQVRRSEADTTRYVGSHPMAGSHRSGPLTARADLFVDRTWVIAPTEVADHDRIDEVKKLALSCGARVELMDPVEHDVAVAEISHVPQIVSSLMAGNLTDVPHSHLMLSGQGVRDVTRIAASDETMWTQIITANRAAIQTQLARLSRALAEVEAHLDSPVAVAEFLRHGIAGTRALPGKHGRSALEWAHVVVEIPDSPGALAKLFAQVEAVGVNVEDLEIEHDRDREVGYINVAVGPNQAGELAQAMTDAGWTLKP